MKVVLIAALVSWGAAAVALEFSHISELWALFVFAQTMSVFMIMQWGLRPENVFGERFVRRWNPSRAAFGLEPADEDGDRKSRD